MCSNNNTSRELVKEKIPQKGAGQIPLRIPRSDSASQTMPTYIINGQRIVAESPQAAYSRVSGVTQMPAVHSAGIRHVTAQSARRAVAHGADVSKVTWADWRAGGWALTEKSFAATPLAAYWETIDNRPLAADDFFGRQAIYARIMGEKRLAPLFTRSDGLLLHGLPSAHFLWGYAVQLDWQWRSGRLGCEVGDSSIAPESWWGRMNYTLCALPYVAAADAGLLELASEFVASGGAEEASRPELAVWKAHTATLNAATPLYSAEFALQPVSEQSFGAGWARFVEVLAALHFRTDLDFIAQTGAGYLPPHVLDAAGQGDDNTVRGGDACSPEDVARIQETVQITRQTNNLGDCAFSLMLGFWQRIGRNFQCRVAAPAVIQSSSKPEAKGRAAAQLLWWFPWPGKADKIELPRKVRFIVFGMQRSVFLVDIKATKPKIKEAVRQLYDVKCAKVNTLIRPDGRKKGSRRQCFVFKRDVLPCHGYDCKRESKRAPRIDYFYPVAMLCPFGVFLEFALFSSSRLRADGFVQQRGGSARKPPAAPQPVTLHIYDVGSGAFHTGVEIYGLEWSFNNLPHHLTPHGDPLTGIFCSRPKTVTVHNYAESVEVGKTRKTQEEFALLLTKMEASWRADTFNVLKKNCCHFCDDLCRELGVGGIPDRVLNLASLGGGISDACSAPHMGCLWSSSETQSAASQAGVGARRAPPARGRRQMAMAGVSTADEVTIDR
ncbi:unnamed protein product [Polarella glacialis]|uniref:PPPDE domain-containing protein n=1 Tax=Polarella glacialis TaxID=89957 RepID=A0A813LR03_POLGL|nr:unnamed protein product [Polarella glacialis]